MFTGLVEQIGTVIGIDPQDTSESGGNGWSLTIGDAASILGDCHIGDSIAINGMWHYYYCKLATANLSRFIFFRNVLDGYRI